MSIINKIVTKFYVAESYPNKVKIIWNNKNINKFKDNIDIKYYVSLDNFNRIHLCSEDELLFVWNSNLHYIKKNENHLF